MLSGFHPGIIALYQFTGKQEKLKMLQELSQLKQKAEEFVEENLSTELEFSESAKQRILELYQQLFSEHRACLQDGLIKTVNNKDQAAYLPFNWFSRIKNCRSFIEALKVYAEYTEQLKNILDDSVMRDLPKIDWQHTLPEENVTLIKQFINDSFDNDGDKQCFTDFLDGKVWLNIRTPGTLNLSGKKLNRQSSDYIASCITSICKLINDTAGKLDHFIRLYIESDEVRNIINRQDIVTSENNTTQHSHSAGKNIIYYGAPGTGKSYKVKSVMGGSIYFRTIFHPDTQYADFVGSLRPQTSIDQNGNTRIAYKFRPGPFTRAFIEASKCREQGKIVYLVIEELNRAPAAAVFGELFQLLDRKADGSSEYEIDIADPDMLAYINENLPIPISSLALPFNLSIIATMNSSDQAVMPMDTAFKRRWNFEYIPIDYAQATLGLLPVPVAVGGINNIVRVPWRSFAEIINNRLKALQIPEDRLLGHRFLSDEELLNDDTAKKTLCGKLFVYLWDDVLRHGQREAIFNTRQCHTFGELAALFRNNGAVFTEELEVEFSAAADKLTKNQENIVSDEE